MKVKELIAELQKYDPQANAMLWMSGKHAAVGQVDPMFWDGKECGGVLPIISCRREAAKPNDNLSKLLEVIDGLDSK